jgi:hypothetical protein
MELKQMPTSQRFTMKPIKRRAASLSLAQMCQQPLQPTPALGLIQLWLLLCVAYSLPVGGVSSLPAATPSPWLGRHLVYWLYCSRAPPVQVQVSHLLPAAARDQC